MTKVMKVVLIVLVVIIVAVGAVAWYVLGSMRSDAVETVAKPSDLEATAEETAEPDIYTVLADDPTPSPTPMPIYEEESLADNVVNILLIGTDSRNADESENSEGRSDTMILASLDKAQGKITLVSFMRDARVKRIGSSGKFTFYNRLNGAYRGGYGGGGAGELINTINYNFDLDIQQYIAIGFDGFAVLIDQIGGLDVELDQAEINFINDRIKGDHELEPDIVKNASTISADPGIVHLDGAQCLIYARNRHSGVDGGDGNDYDRVSRQQEIIELIYEKITTQMNEQSVYALISFACNYIETNMKFETMTSLAKILLNSDVTFDSVSVPAQGTYSYWVNDEGERTELLKFDLDDAADELNELLYGTAETPTPEPTESDG